VTRTTLRNVVCSLLMAVGALGCGQQGPLVLPGDARPVERVETPPAVEPDSPDNEDQDER
jgi:predicted small lipoprotein YifL